MTDAVKPLAQDCPFCGKGARTWEDELGFRGASCSDAECSASELIMTIEQWDRRTPPAGWKPIETAPEKGRCLLTNNLHAVDAHGLMSHIWIGFPIKSGHEWITFDDRDWKVRGLTHWMPLPAAPGNDDEQN